MFIVEITNRWRFISIIIIFRSKLLLNFVLSSSYKEHKVIKDFYNDAPSPFLKPILVELAQRN